MQPFRTLLFAPANRPELIEKFPRYKADAFAIDLEDGTPEAEKDAARRALSGVVASLRSSGLKGRLFVRTNAPRSPHVEADLEAALAASIDGVMIPKLSTVAGLQGFGAALSRAEARIGRPFELIGLIETVAGVANVEALASAGESHLTTLGFGAEDFITDIGGRRTAGSLEVLYARSRVVLAAKAARLAALDQVFVHLRDEDGLRRDAEFGRQLGYDGKMCIAPGQVAVANEVFAPSPDEIERSRRLIQACQAAKAEGRGVIEFEGAMVDEPLLRRAEAIVRLAESLRSP